MDRICFPPEEAKPMEIMCRFVEKIPEQFLVAEDRGTGKVAGFLCGISSDEARFTDEFFTDLSLNDPAAQTVYLLGLDILPEYRGQGLARELMKLYGIWSQVKGKHRMVLTAHEEKVGLYEKLGFTDLGISDSTWGGGYDHAVNVLSYDQETICPIDAMEEQGEVWAFLNNQSYKLIKDPAFIEAAEYLYEHRSELEELDRVMAEQLHRNYLQSKNVTPELQHEFMLTFNRAFVNWSKAREAGDYSLFAPSLKEVADTNRRMIELRGADAAGKTAYDSLLDDYERGMTSDVLDEVFGACKERLIPLLEKIRKSPKKIRTDFLSRRVEDEQQAKMVKWILTQMGFNFNRGAFTTSEHPFTASMGRYDTRITTHYYPTRFLSSMYSTIHEGGHALFDQNQPQENHDHFIIGGKTLGMHESVSRFYENRIGRSEAFVHFAYPKVCEVFPQVMADVSEREFYEAVNAVSPSLIRTEADEFTYTFHIIIRYEIEKALFAGEIKVEDIPALWNKKYQEYLGVCPTSDREGALQDVHWTSGFGYFPTYAIGNFYNAMYYNRLKEEVDVNAAIREGNFAPLNDWMIGHVFDRADRLSPKEWIKDITGREFTLTGREFTPVDFLDYLEAKYSELYEL